jgi:hypothetical protein
MVDRAKAVCRSRGKDPAHHFDDVVVVIPKGRWGKTSVKDTELTRYACYLIAMNGDPRKPEISAAQNYFAEQTRRAELAAPTPLIVVQAPQAAPYQERAWGRPKPVDAPESDRSPYRPAGTIQPGTAYPESQYSST